MTAEHKDKLAAGRQAGAAVRRYIEALEREAQRAREPEIDVPAIQAQVLELVAEIKRTPNPLGRLKLMAKRDELTAVLSAVEPPSGPPIEELRAAFVKLAGPWIEAKGYTRSQLAELGVPKDALDEAGIK